MSGILPAGRPSPGSAVAAAGATGRQREADACLRARRTAGHRPVVDAAPAAVLESQAAACGVMHRHFEGRRHASDMRDLYQARWRAPQHRTRDKQDADIAVAGVESRLPATSVRAGDSIEGNLPSTLAAPVGLCPHASWFVRTWHALRALLGRLPLSLHPRGVAAAGSPSVAARRQASAALGFREFTVPRRRPVGNPAQLRVKSATLTEATHTVASNTEAQP